MAKKHKNETLVFYIFKILIKKPNAAYDPR